MGKLKLGLQLSGLPLDFLQFEEPESRLNIKGYWGNRFLPINFKDDLLHPWDRDSPEV